MVVKAYHTLEDKDNYDEIELDGPYECTHRGAWLGRGAYFWDTNINWAHEWGEIGYKKRGRDYVITETQVDLGLHCFDLVGSVGAQQDLLQCIEVMLASGKIKDAKSAVIPNLIQFMKEKGIFPYSSIRAADMHQKIVRLKFRKDRQEYMTIGQRVQICVIHKKGVILHPLKVIYPEN